MQRNNHVCISYVDIDEKKSITEAVEKAVLAALTHENALDRFVSVELTNDSVIHEYNREYPDGFLGDIMISIPRAEEQGKELRHSTEREIIFLTVHGLLHLLGYDHMTEEDESIMLPVQRSIVSEIAE